MRKTDTMPICWAGCSYSLTSSFCSSCWSSTRTQSMLPLFVITLGHDTERVDLLKVLSEGGLGSCVQDGLGHASTWSLVKHASGGRLWLYRGEGRMLIGGCRNSISGRIGIGMASPYFFFTSFRKSVTSTSLSTLARRSRPSSGKRIFRGFRETEKSFLSSTFATSITGGLFSPFSLQWCDSCTSSTKLLHIRQILLHPATFLFLWAKACAKYGVFIFRKQNRVEMPKHASYNCEQHLSFYPHGHTMLQWL